jgi:hypothetical protein
VRRDEIEANLKQYLPVKLVVWYKNQLAMPRPVFIEEIIDDEQVLVSTVPSVFRNLRTIVVRPDDLFLTYEDHDRFVSGLRPRIKP